MPELTAPAPPGPQPSGMPAVGVSVRSFRQRLLRAGGWSVLSHTSTQIIRLGGNLLIARWLMPEAFALSTVVAMLLVGLTLFSDFGVFQNVVRHPHAEERRFLDTAWTLQILRGLVIWMLALGVAVALPFLAEAGWVGEHTVYADPRLPWMVAVATFSAVLQGLESTRVLVERRHMRLNRLTLIDLTTQLSSAAVMITVAWLTRSVWALVVGGVLSALIRCVMTHTLLPGPPNRLALQPAVLRELIGFGKWVFLSSILFFLVSNSDRLILSNLIDSVTFGLYSIGFLLATAPALALNTLAGSVALPALSEVVRDRPADLRRVVNQFQRLSDRLLMPLVGFLGVAGSSVVALFYDDRYQAAGPILSTLAWGAAASRYVMLEQCYLAVGRPEVLTAVNVIRFLGAFGGIPLAYAWAGFHGALVAIVLTQYAGWPVAFYFRHQQRLLDWKTECLAVPWLVLGILAGAGFGLAMRVGSGGAQ